MSNNSYRTFSPQFEAILSVQVKKLQAELTTIAVDMSAQDSEAKKKELLDVLEVQRNELKEKREKLLEEIKEKQRELSKLDLDGKALADQVDLLQSAPFASPPPDQQQKKVDNLKFL